MTEEKQISYLDLGFNSYGMRVIGISQQIPANLADYMLEIAESSVSNNKIKSMSADKITTGTITAVASIGESNVKIDGEENRILINDGTNDRVLIGKAVGLF